MDSPLQKSNVVMLSTDERIFERGSNVQDRMIHYEGIADELHIIVISRSKYETIKLTNNVYVYSATSFFRILALGNAIRLGRKIIRGKKGQWIV